MVTLIARLEGLLRGSADRLNEVAGWLYLGGAVFITANVITRRFFGFSSPALVEITGYLLAFGISLGLAHALATKAHIRVDVIVTKLPLRFRAYLHVVALVSLALFSVLLAWRGWQVVAQSWKLDAHDTTALRIPLAVPQAVWWLGLGLLALLAVAMVIRAVALLTASRYRELDELLGPPTESEQTAEFLPAESMGSEPRVEP